MEAAPTETVAVMSINETTPVQAVANMRYYSYRCSTTTPTVREFNKNYLIGQGDTSVTYPSGQRPAGSTTNKTFYDSQFYKVCGKTRASGTIKENGCAICSLAMALLYKANITNTNDNVYYAVKAATVQGTNDKADLYYGPFKIVFNNGVTLNVEKRTHQLLDPNGARLCLYNLYREEKGGKKTHFVLGYKRTMAGSGLDQYLAADPRDGKFRTLKEALIKTKIEPDAQYIYSYVIT